MSDEAVLQEELSEEDEESEDDRPQQQVSQRQGEDGHRFWPVQRGTDHPKCITLNLVRKKERHRKENRCHVLKWRYDGDDETIFMDANDLIRSRVFVSYADFLRELEIGDCIAL